MSHSISDNIVLNVDSVSKKFCKDLKRSMFYGISDLAKGMVGIKPDTSNLRPKEFWALKDINFSLRKGEILGVIGANGAGKSTLLRTLTGIFPPDLGKIWMNGSIGGIIALNAGMHPHMTARENIYLNGTIMGMSKKEIDEKFDEIVEFAEIGDFLDAPLNTFSSGMKVRLGFAVAIQFEPDILLVDEVLAVGDMNFKQKSMRRMSQIMSSDKSIIFISHSTNLILQICDRCILLDKGEIVMDGEPTEVVYRYHEMQARMDVDKPQVTGDRIDIKNIILNGRSITEDIEVNSGDDLDFEINFDVQGEINDVYVSFGFGMGGRNLSIYNTNYYDKSNLLKLTSDTKVRLRIPQPELPQGEYKMRLGVWDANTNHCYYWNYESVGSFYVNNKKEMYSQFMFHHDWEVINS